MSSALKDWLKHGWLKPHKTSSQEIADLLAVADSDLTACKTPGLHNDWRFNIAYNAALQLSSAALAISGYQAERTNHHYRVIDSLSHTLAVDSKTIEKFDLFRKKRNISDYERADMISDTEADEMIALAMSLRRGLIAWIRKYHPSLKA
jgi:hypothetical protein